MHIILYLFGLVYCVSSISIQPTFRSSRLKARSNPSFIGDNKNLPKLQDDSSQGGIAKRTDPTFYNGDYGKTTEGTDRKSLLEDAFPDVYTLVLTALNHWDDVIFDHWFPPRDKAKVENVLTSIINSQDAPPGETGGADLLQYFFIMPWDTLAGTNNDICAKGGDAYTINYTPGAGNPDYAVCHFCKFTFEDDAGDDNAPTLDSIDLENFEFNDGYRITNEMEPIAATVLHEITHFNSVGSGTGLQQPAKFKAIIGDEAGPNPETDYGVPYWAWQLRGDVTDDNDPCLKNADSYVWFALESYWTYTFKNDLKDQGGYFNAPKKP